MKTSSFEIKVGIFIIIGFMILVMIIFSIGEVYFFKRGYNIKVLFNFANGIAMNAPVRVAGVEVGEVDNIRLYFDTEEKKAKVELSAWIKEGVRIEKDAEAVINTLGLLGEKYLEIFPGMSEVALKDEDVLVGTDPVSVENMTMDMRRLVDNANVVVERLKEGEGTLGRFLTDESIYENLEAFTADIKENPWKLMHKPKGE